MPTRAALPEWAQRQERDGPMPLINVDVQSAYPALRDEYRELYADPANWPAPWRKADGALKAEFASLVDELNDEEWTQYWAEVCYQSAKMDVQAAVDPVNLYMEIRMQDPGKQYAQGPVHDEQAGESRGGMPAGRNGRGASAAAGGPQGGREAREHYKRLRGMIPGA